MRFDENAALLIVASTECKHFHLFSYAPSFNLFSLFVLHPVKDTCEHVPLQELNLLFSTSSVFSFFFPLVSFYFFLLLDVIKF